MNRNGRTTTPFGLLKKDPSKSFTGNEGLEINEPLLFEVGRTNTSGVDIDFPASLEDRLGGFKRTRPLGLAGLSEPEAMRHYVRLSRRNFAIDLGLYPLGSCTMKHNPRLNEKLARLSGFGDVHPLQPLSTVQGALEVIHVLAHWLRTLTGMPTVAMSPKAGAHGEMCGMMAIRAALDARGEDRKIVLVPESAHGTNPATAAYLGYTTRTIAVRSDGTVDPDDVERQLSSDVAAIMLTNPNTCGLFERDIVGISDAVHNAGAFFYCDGANFNAIAGLVRPGDLGIDAMHINLHKTFSTPHGGGGPGAGPVVLSEALTPFAPLPYVVYADGQYQLVEHEGEASVEACPFGRMTAFHGQMGMFVRALSYMLSHGADGIQQASRDAVLNANYVRAGLEDVMSLPFSQLRSMHEVLFDDTFLKGTGVSTLDFAKAMIDEGFHPMTVYFPLVVHGAMLIEPTESESREALDQFVATMRKLVNAATSGDRERFIGAPRFTPVGRLDETRAARQPILRWTGNADHLDAAE
ncbi:glycine dehydrogenase subunit 2 [Rhodoligotrophos appendicifer]|uniref:aminomethyl-transferring glycine dehydrogenase subunit GcvPB n=1 Tax=Rhodoligotrophos appendicifer TaxID=987056 RepID=UPI001185E359|nr:aminomethyl-transferring glycine dehydrogenase subunit GcvPB [Rhodoligotrophos appendicifer]